MNYINPYIFRRLVTTVNYKYDPPDIPENNLSIESQLIISFIMFL